MKRRIICPFILLQVLVTVYLSSCSGREQPSLPAATQKQPAGPSKPPSSFQDSLSITTRAAVFYEPDSLQIEKIKAVTEEWIFNGSMHEYYSQVRNAHAVLKKDWPGVNIIDARRVRYLVFVKANGERERIDLDQKGDAYGLFVFDTRQSPRLIDMTNIESQVHDYFSSEKSN